MILLNKPKKMTTNTRDGGIIALDWNSIEKGVNLFKDKIKNMGDFDKILVMVRGGMVPAIILSHLINKRDLIFFQGVKTASNKPHDYTNFHQKLLPQIKRSNKFLIIEDIIFEGDTVFNAIDYVHDKEGVIVGVCSLVIDELFFKKYNKKNKIPLVGAYVCDHLKWIRFPWERKIKEEVEANL